MSYASDIRNNAGDGSLRGRVTGFLDTLAERRQKARTYRTTLRELQNLTDRDLADLGVARSNLHDIARQAAYGH